MLRQQAARTWPVNRRVVLCAVLASCLVAAGCGWFKERWQWNQKLTVEVETPNGVRTGSAVSHVYWADANALGNYYARYSGEATVVDLGDGRYLFALIGEATKQIAAYTLHKEFGEQRSAYGKLFPKVMLFRGVRNVPDDRYPLLVTFTDIKDPASVVLVDPDDLAATFGPGVSLKRVTLEITDEKMTRDKVELVLPWLSGWSGGMLDGRRVSTAKAANRFANDLGAGNFRVKRWSLSDIF